MTNPDSANTPTDDDKYQPTVTRDSNSPTGRVIPENLDEAIIELKKLDPDLIEEIKNMPLDEFTAKSHFGLGLWIRNNWLFSKSSKLSRFLVENHGLFDADYMSGYILGAFWEYLNQNDLEIDNSSCSLYDESAIRKGVADWFYWKAENQSVKERDRRQFRNGKKHW